MQQPPGAPEQAAWSGLEIRASFNPLQIFLNACTPIADVHGYTMPVRWNVPTPWQLQPGQYQLRFHIPYMGSNAGKASANVVVYPGHVTKISYQAPVGVVFSAGRLQTTGYQPTA